MTVTIGNRYELIAGHFLPKVPVGHKCSRPHGHNYEIEIVISGKIKETGFIVDFYDLDKVMKPLLEMLDHQMLNDIDGLENPTAEIIALWFHEKLITKMPDGAKCDSVKVWETKNCWALSTGIEF